MKTTCKSCGRQWEASECRVAKGNYICPWCTRRKHSAAIGLACFALLYGTVGGMEHGRTSLLAGTLLCVVWLAGMAVSVHLGQKENRPRTAIRIGGIRNKSTIV